MPELSLSPEAKKDLADIKSYISESLKNPQAAANVVSRIIQQIKKLPQFLQIGIPLAKKVLFETKYYFVVCGNYLAFYFYKGEDIFVSRIIYGKRDYIRILFPEMREAETSEEE